MNKSKKIKYLGTEEYINATTGELIEMQVSNIEERDFNFKKVWIRDFLHTLEIVGNKKTKVAYWIIDNIKSDNSIIFVYEEVAKETNTTKKTVGEVVNALLAADFMRRICPSVYMLNPNLVFKGDYQQRMYNLNVYNSTEKKEISNKEKLANLQKTMERILKEMEILTQKIAEENSSTIDGQMNISDLKNNEQVNLYSAI